MLGRQMNIYIRKPIYATVIWKAQNIILKSEQVEIGDSATPPSVEIEGYNFISWDKSYNKIIGSCRRRSECSDEELIEILKKVTVGGDTE